MVSGSVPHLGIKFVRIHFLLDLIHAVDASNVPGGASNTNFTIFTSGYLKGKALNWTDLDASLDIVIDAGLYPGFEVMGNPSGNLFTSFKDDNQLHAWSQMCYELARRYIARYGEDSVRQWRFESWNGWILTPACTFWHRAWLCDLFSPFGLRALVCVCVLCVVLHASSEPDGECHHGLDTGIDCDLPSFLHYFDATEYGLHRADPEVCAS